MFEDAQYMMLTARHIELAEKYDKLIHALELIALGECDGGEYTAYMMEEAAEAALIAVGHWKREVEE